MDEEIILKKRRIFDFLDTNKIGLIESEKLKFYYELMGLNLNETQLSSRLESITLIDGKISFEEIEKLSSNRRFQCEQIKVSGPIEKAGAFFRALDTDKNNAINVNDFRKLSTLGIFRATQEQIENKISTLQDDKITTAEFYQFIFNN
eukprot:TRINITY_DN1555_c4_g1_i1.p1 TRINITY_DN1555_c4_g1~~TRINITY_DN1555_c4_g1_i1.p1  ORF type:complete len:148 (+),score=59.62 TRINITY_DN1555_c4_g1_i1:70-513(+)